MVEPLVGRLYSTAGPTLKSRQHKLDSTSYCSIKNKTQGWLCVATRKGHGEGLEMGNEYDQNILCEVLKELINILF